MIKRRNPLVAFFLSLVPGLGQFYNGQLRKGFIILGVDLLYPIVFGFTGLLSKLSGLVALIVFAIVFILFRMIDGLIEARKLENYEIKKYNKWYFYLAFVAILYGVRLILDLPTDRKSVV